MRRTLALLAVLLFTSGIGLSAQQTGSPAAVTVPEAEPYDEAEFPGWLVLLRRAEVVAVGSFPFTMLASQLLYTVGRYALFSLSAGQSLPEYLPPLFAAQGAVPLNSDDNRAIVLGAVGLSVLIATADFLLGLEQDAGAR